MEDDEEAHRPELGVGERLDGMEAPGGEAVDARQEEDPHHPDEEVGGRGEDAARLLHPPQVAPRQDQDERQRDRHPVGEQGAEGGGERRGPRRHRDRDRQDVVGQQRHPGDLGRQEPEVVAGDQVGAARLRVGLDGLAVGEQEDAEDRQERQGDRDHHREDADGGRLDQDVQDLLGRVRRRGEVVAGEDGQGGRLAEPLVDETLGRQRRPDDQPLEAAEPLGDPGA